MVNKLRSGFTLIEMLVVIAIISILAGVVLTGVGGFQAGARDSKRIADLKIVQNYLETYNNVHGHYPGGCTGSSSAYPTTWQKSATGACAENGSLTDALKLVGSIVPNDPLASSTNNRHYVYAVNDSLTAYLLGAVLEKANSQLNSAQNIVGGIPADFNHVTTDGEADCDYTVGGTNFSYCISS